MAGRSARLGDGTSRNPPNRDELLAQRTADLRGLSGQVRGFDLDGFLSDWEPAGQSLPWCVGDSGWVSGKAEDKPPDAKAKARPNSVHIPVVGSVSSLEPIAPLHGQFSHLAYLMQSGGIAPALKVLYVPDYVPAAARIASTQELFRTLSAAIPGYDIRLALAEGPFEDDDGVGAHVEALALQGGPKQAGLLRKDIHVSVV